MNISMLAIGNELLENVCEKNSLFLSRLLMENGLQLEKKLIVRDKIEEIKKALEFLTLSSDIIILSGGLGPTEDDITKEGLAAFLGEELYINDKLIKRLEAFFRERGKTFVKSNIKQAYVFKNSIILDNPYGTACGLYLKRKDKTFVLLPGVPTEWEEMLKLHLKNIIEIKGKIFSFYYHCFDISEAELDRIIKSKINDNIHSFGTIAKHGITTFRLDIESKDKNKAQNIAKNFLKALGIEDKILEIEETLEKELVNRLSEKNKKIAFAESCTGGLLSKRITDISGSSKVFYGGIVCYNNDVKINILKVPEKIIEEYGAVSQETITYMDMGLSKLFPRVDYRISVSGIAGPTGGTKEKPVGTIFVGFGDTTSLKVEKLNFSGNREEIREKTANYIFAKLLKELGG